MYSRYDNRYFAATRRQPKRVGGMRALVLVLIVAIVIAGAGFIKTALGTVELSFSQPLSGGGSSNAATSTSSSTSSSTATGEFIGTPIDQWQQGVMPILYQQDPLWNDYPYAGTNFGISGCGPACLSMVFVYLTGDTSYTPTALAGQATSAGYTSPDGTDWAFMTQSASGVGIGARELPADRDLIVSSLRAGNPIIAVLGAGDFTTTGHFIVLTGIDSTGMVTVHDPNSVERTQQSWDLDRLMYQFRNLWVYYVE